MYAFVTCLTSFLFILTICHVVPRELTRKEVSGLSFQLNFCTLIVHFGICLNANFRPYWNASGSHSIRIMVPQCAPTSHIVRVSRTIEKWIILFSHCPPFPLCNTRQTYKRPKRVSTELIPSLLLWKSRPVASCMLSTRAYQTLFTPRSRQWILHLSAGTEVSSAHHF